MDEGMPDSIDRARLARYVAGECDDAERAHIEAWLDARPSRRRLLASLDDVWRLTADDTAWDVDAAWQAVQARRRALEPAAATRGRSRLASWAVRAAAIIALVAGGAVVFDRLQRDEAPPASTVAAEFTTDNAEQREVTLDDGSVVVLAPESRLRILPPFGAGSREVELAGQAAFRVTHDAAIPFRVRAGSLVTEVLGTRFVVRAYGDDIETTVALVEGSVRVRAPGEADPARAITLVPGQVARVDEGVPRILADADVESWLAWTEGRLTFDDTPLTDVARELARWYDVDVELADSALAQRRLTGSFTREPIAQVMDLIALSLDLRYERSGRAFVLTPR